MDPQVLKSVVVPCALFFSIVLALKLVLDAFLRYRLLKEGVSDGLLERMLLGETRRRRMEALRWGMLLVAGGLALVVIHVAGWSDEGLVSAAVLAIAIGTAQLAFYRLGRDTG